MSEGMNRLVAIIGVILLVLGLMTSASTGGWFDTAMRFSKTNLALGIEYIFLQVIVSTVLDIIGSVLLVLGMRMLMITPGYLGVP